MAGQRDANLHDLQFQPGVVTNAPPRDVKGRWADANRVRWHKGWPEKIGGWERQELTGANGGTYIGFARGVADWASLDGQEWIAFGTECKLYLINNGTLYDITPIRKSSNLTDPFATVLGSGVVTIFDPDHRAQDGDHITLIGASAVGGITLEGDYDITAVVDPDHYTITQSVIATSTATGGGSVTIEYDISCGLPRNGELLGYGTGLYSAGTYGTPRSVGTGVPAKMRTWSLQNWGEDLVASYSDGEIYWWQRSNGPNSRAALILTAPTSVQRILVNPENRYLIAIGASNLAGDIDRMNVRWCSQEDLNDWVPVITPVANTAGGKRLDYGSRMVTGVITRSQILLWSDTQLYVMQYLGTPLIFGFDEKGACHIVGPNAMVDVNGVVYFMGFDDFFIYDGTLRPLHCDMWETVFGALDDDQDLGFFNRTQAEATFCSSYVTKNEVTWFYPSVEAQDAVRYITYNYKDDCWYGGVMQRTAYHDVSPAITGYFENPYGFNAGKLYKQEVGTDEREDSETINAMDWFLQSWDIGAQSDKPMLINSIVPAFQRLKKGLQFRLRQKEFPESDYQDSEIKIVTPTTTQCDIRACGSQIALRIERAVVAEAIVYGQDFRLGTWQSLATPYGQRRAGGNPGDPIDTSGP